MTEQPDQATFDFDAQPVRKRPSLAFWHPITGDLDRKYLRVCAVYRLLRKGAIGRKRATELLVQRHSKTEMISLGGTMDLWRQWSIRDMKD